MSVNEMVTNNITKDFVNKIASENRRSNMDVLDISELTNFFLNIIELYAKFGRHECTFSADAILSNSHYWRSDVLGNVARELMDRGFSAKVVEYPDDEYAVYLDVNWY